MDIGRYVAQLRDDLTAAAAAGDEQTQRTAALLGAAIEPAARLALMNALADLAAEITAELGDRTVEVRLDGRDVRVAVGPEHVAEPPPPPAAARPGYGHGRHQPDHPAARRADQGPGRAGGGLAGGVAQLVGGPGRAGGAVRPAARNRGGPRGLGRGRGGPEGRESDRPHGPDDGRHLRGWVEG